MLVAFVKTLLSFSLEAVVGRIWKTPPTVSDLLTQNPDEKETSNETLSVSQPWPQRRSLSTFALKMYAECQLLKVRRKLVLGTTFAYLYIVLPVLSGSQYSDSLRGWRSGVCIPGRCKECPFLKNHPDRLWAHPAPYSMGVGFLSSR